MVDATLVHRRPRNVAKSLRLGLVGVGCSTDCNELPGRRFPGQGLPSGIECFSDPRAVTPLWLLDFEEIEEAGENAPSLEPFPGFSRTAQTGHLGRCEKPACLKTMQATRGWILSSDRQILSSLTESL